MDTPPSQNWSNPPRAWNGLKAHKLELKPGTNDAKRARALKGIIANAGGADAVLERLSCIDGRDMQPDHMLLALAAAFKLDRRMYSGLVVCFWTTSGSPAILAETSLYGGLYCVHGTHMRGAYWSWKLMQHPTVVRELAAQGAKKFTYPECWALNLIAMLTADVVVFDRVCRQSRKSFWHNGFAPFWSAIHGDEASFLKVLRRRRTGSDTDNRDMQFAGGDDYNVERCGANGQTLARLGREQYRQQYPLIRQPYDVAVQTMIDIELPSRVGYFAYMKASLASCPPAMISPIDVFALHAMLPNPEMLRQSEQLERSTNDEAYRFDRRRDRAEGADYYARFGVDETPFGKFIMKAREHARAKFDKMSAADYEAELELKRRYRAGEEHPDAEDTDDEDSSYDEDED